jgi:hypothetical protein
MIRCSLAILIGLAALLGLPALGAVGGWYGGLQSVGIPEDPHCGLAGLLAGLAGAFGAFFGTIGGGICGMAVFAEILEQQSFEFGDDDAP